MKALRFPVFRLMVQLAPSHPNRLVGLLVLVRESSTFRRSDHGPSQVCLNSLTVSSSGFSRNPSLDEIHALASHVLKNIFVIFPCWFQKKHLSLLDIFFVLPSGLKEVEAR